MRRVGAGCHREVAWRFVHGECHTVKRMKTTALLPKLSDRDARISEKKGSLDTHARAMLRVREILAHDNTHFSPSGVSDSFSICGVDSWKAEVA